MEGGLCSCKAIDPPYVLVALDAPVGLKNVKDLIAFLKKWYPKTTPAYLVYKAGCQASESLARTTLDGMATAADKSTEKFLGLIYVGPCLGGG